ncbi:MAG: RNA methyltransferase [Alloprevotella sp.]|nr:RNA methyltransferase [Alloprevotella sp.]MBR1733489.1 RNA methyltransferase [Alloprevotella sp.]
MEKLTRNETKFIRSLAQKKVRDAENAFLAEGPKAVSELFGKYPCRLLVGTPAYFERCPQVEADEYRTASLSDMGRASLLKTPREVLAVFGKSDGQPPAANLPEKELCLALDAVQDPGNLGTILRIADWFGIRTALCSPGTADVYAPKVVQATMGAIGRVRVHYLDLGDYIASLAPSVPVYGTFLDGESLYAGRLTPNGLVVMGNEGNGISPELARLVHRRLLIPSYPALSETSESLNVAVATAIVCAEFRRQAVP